MKSNLCACGCGQRGDDLHHALIGRKKGFPELDDIRNLVLVNHWEHINRKFDTLKWRRFFWEYQVKQYGPAMDIWVKSLPDKLRHRLDFMTKG